jgi:outer membrane protein assembly factor BamB
MMPCNGLIYTTPHPCRCFIEEKLSGLYALAPEGKLKSRKVEQSKSERLQRGPAYADIPHLASRIEHPDAWPTYRHDPRRSGSTTSEVPAELTRVWEAEIGVALSAPVIADGNVLVAAVDQHRVCAISADDGGLLWSFTAGGPVDTPPTIHHGLALFGARDGYVYCLRASDGALVWRLRAAPEERRLVAYGQVESAWPVHGSVLVVDDMAYFAAGRSSHLDGGIHLFGVDPRTGKTLREETLTTPLATSQKEHPRGALADILVFDGRAIRMRQLQLGRVDADPSGQAARKPSLHLLATGGLLDDSWFSRIYWAVNGRALGQMLVFDEDSAYGIRAFARPGDVNAHFTPGKQGYRLFAHDHRQPRANTAADKPGTKKRRGKQPLQDRWQTMVPVRAQSLTLAGETLFVAGTPDVADTDDPWAAFDGHRGGLLWAVAAADGKKLAEYKLDAPPVYDGMAAAGGRLYLSTADGRVVCMGGNR